MSDYPKNFEKDGRVKVASSRRHEVELRFDGYREVPTEPVKEAPELTEAEMAQVPEAKDAEVVDTTEDTNWEINGGAPKPTAPKRKN